MSMQEIRFKAVGARLSPQPQHSHVTERKETALRRDGAKLLRLETAALQWRCKSKSGRMIKELPRQLEFFGKRGRQRLHAKRFCGVMTAVKNVHAQFLRQRVRPVRAFAGDESVHAFLGGAF